MDLYLEWARCAGGHWCPFLSIDLQHPEIADLEGVYIIWQAVSSDATIYVGQGHIASRLSRHRATPEITKHSNLYVTWAAVGFPYRDGVERYLIDQLRPVETERAPATTQPIVVNLPRGT